MVKVIKKTKPAELNLNYILNFLYKKKITTRDKIEKILKNYNIEYDIFINKKLKKIDDTLLIKLESELHIGKKLLYFLLSEKCDSNIKKKKVYYLGFFFIDLMYDNEQQLVSLHKFFEPAYNKMIKFVKKEFNIDFYQNHIYWYLDLIELED